MQNDYSTHKLELDFRKKLTITGVQSLDGFSEQLLNLTVSGNKLKICGTNIKITVYNKSTGTLIADGNFNEIKYQQQSKPFIKKIFK